MIKDFVEGGVGMDVCAIRVGSVNNLSCQIGEYYEWVVLGKMGDVENGRCDGEIMRV